MHTCEPKKLNATTCAVESPGQGGVEKRYLTRERSAVTFDAGQARVKMNLDPWIPNLGIVCSCRGRSLGISRLVMLASHHMKTAEMKLTQVVRSVRWIVLMPVRLRVFMFYSPSLCKIHVMQNDNNCDLASISLSWNRGGDGNGACSGAGVD